jgi:hypothetical protein
VFTAQLHSNERGADPQRTPLATPLLLLRDVTAYVVCSKSFGTFEIARQLDVLAMSGKLCCLLAFFLIIIRVFLL